MVFRIKVLAVIFIPKHFLAQEGIGDVCTHMFGAKIIKQYHSFR